MIQTQGEALEDLELPFWNHPSIDARGQAMPTSSLRHASHGSRDHQKRLSRWPCPPKKLPQVGAARALRVEANIVEFII